MVLEKNIDFIGIGICLKSATLFFIQNLFQSSLSLDFEVFLSFLAFSWIEKLCCRIKLSKKSLLNLLKLRCSLVGLQRWETA
jgi:hypothetical protein